METGWQGVTVESADELRALVGEPTPRVAAKVRRELDEVHVRWLANSPFCLVATAGEDGTCDVSPKGDPAGFTIALDAKTIAIPERPGNRRVDGFLNILSNPHVGLLYFIPGRGDTLRINGRAQLVREATFFDQMIVKGHRPQLALVVDVQEVFFHCSKAFLRSELWDPASWQPDAVPSRPEIAQIEMPGVSKEKLAEYYGPGYADRLYRSGR